MNDHDAIDKINAVLDQWFKSEVPDHEALRQIAHISGLNHFEHEEARP